MWIWPLNRVWRVPPVNRMFSSDVFFNVFNTYTPTINSITLLQNVVISSTEIKYALINYHRMNRVRYRVQCTMYTAQFSTITICDSQTVFIYNSIKKSYRVICLVQKCHAIIQTETVANRIMIPKTKWICVSTILTASYNSIPYN